MYDVHLVFSSFWCPVVKMLLLFSGNNAQGWIEELQYEASFRFAQGQLLVANLSKDTN